MKKEIMLFIEKIDRTGDHPVKRSKPGSTRTSIACYCLLCGIQRGERGLEGKRGTVRDMQGGRGREPGE